MNDGLKFFLVLTGTLLLIAILAVVMMFVQISERMSGPGGPVSNSVKDSQ